MNKIMPPRYSPSASVRVRAKLGGASNPAASTEVIQHPTERRMMPFILDLKSGALGRYGRLLDR